MLPIPFFKYIPKIFSKDSKAVNLSNKIDTHLKQWKAEVLNIPSLYRPDQTPSKFLPEINNLLRGDILQSDSDALKRQKIKTAVKSHKIRGVFTDDVKILLDAVTGYITGIFTQPNPPLNALIGSDADTSYNSTLGADNVDFNLGRDTSGSGYETSTPGNVYINLHVGINTPVLSPAVIQNVIIELQRRPFAYYRVFIGYVNGAGQWVHYANLQELTVSFPSDPIAKIGNDPNWLAFDGNLIWFYDWDFGLTGGRALRAWNLSGVEVWNSLGLFTFIHLSNDFSYEISDDYIWIVTNYTYGVNLKTLAYERAWTRPIYLRHLGAFAYYFENGRLYKVNPSIEGTVNPVVADVIASSGDFPGANLYSYVATSSKYIAVLWNSSTVQRLIVFDTDCVFLRETVITPYTGVLTKRLEIYNNKVFIGTDTNKVVVVDLDTLEQKTSFVNPDEVTAQICIGVDGGIWFNSGAFIRKYTQTFEEMVLPVNYPATKYAGKEIMVHSGKYGLWSYYVDGVSSGLFRRLSPNGSEI